MSSKEKLDTSVFHAVMTPDLKYLFGLFEKHSHEIRIAGGAVRDILMGKIPDDIDFATTATPDQMKKIFNAENIRMINTNGEKHGTITVRLNEENYEITTLRIDVVTNGRHAEVKFTNDWKLDANRRDLTVNSIFLAADGSIIDFFNGYEDIKNRRIKFVGDACMRVQEDYLRILRYFRFYGRVCADENSHDLESLNAIKENSSGLANIAGERIWLEFRKIVCGNFADSLMRHIIETNVHKYIGFPENCNLEEFSRLYKIFEKNIDQMPNAITMVCTLLKCPYEFENLHKRMKFSNEEKKLAEFLLANRHIEKIRNKSEKESLEELLKPYKFILVDNVKDKKIIEKLKELLKYLNKLEYISYLEAWPIPLFPITGEHLEAKGIPKGPMYTKILNNLKENWKNEFNMSTEESVLQKLLNQCDKLITNN